MPDECGVVALFDALREEARDYRRLWEEDAETLRLVRRQVARALYGEESDTPFLDDGLVGELRRVVDVMLDAHGGPLDA